MSYRLRILFLLIAALTPLIAVPVAAQNDHESTLTERSFPQLQLPEEVFQLPDAEFVRVAQRIEAGTATIQERRWFYRAAERYAPFTAVPAPDWKLKAHGAGKKLAPSATIYRWASLGPNGDYDVTRQWGPAGSKNQGRATAVWTHMDGVRAVNKNVIFLGFADGGLWKTADQGQTWTALTDFEPTLSIGAVDVLPGLDLVNYNDATIYLATGEGNFSQPDKDGVGVLKSTDGGRTWVVQPIPWQTDVVKAAGQHRIRRIRIDTRVPGGQSVWMAGDGGVYRTADGGATWHLVTGLPYAGAPATAAFPGGCWPEYATDINIGPQDPTTGKTTLFAVFGNFRNAACTGASDSRKNNGIYRSTDDGVTWTKISLSNQNGFPETPGVVGRMHTFLAPSNPKHMYVLIARSDDYTSLGVWDTLDATAPTVQWTAGASGLNAEYTNGQGWYNLTGAVNPANENHIMVGGLDNWLSINRGATFSRKSGWSAGDVTWAHADHHHAIWVDANTYYDANDGGLNIGRITNNTTVTWTHTNVGDLSTLQFYGLGQSATEPYRINAGLQDNGHGYLNNGVWAATAGGDGGFAAVDQDNDQHAYEEYVYGSIRKSDDGGNTWPTAGCMQAFGACTGCLGRCVPDLHTAFIAWFTLDPHNQNVMYVGTNVLYRNPSARTAGKVWERIGTTAGVGDFVNGSTASSAYISMIHPAAAGGFTTTTLGSKVSKVIYVGTSTGRIWRTTDGGATWTDLTKAPLPVLTPTSGRFVRWIGADPTNAERVIAVYSGWNVSTPNAPGHVFRSTDGGATWTDISGALPDEPFNTVAVNPNAGESNEVYVASDSGVYVNTNAWTGNSWLRINSGMLPHVSVNMLEFTSATAPKRLRAATHGRGIWEMEKGTNASIQLDKTVYQCADTMKIEVQDGNRGAGSVTVSVSSKAESDETVVLQEFPADSGHFVGTITLSGTPGGTGDGRLTVFNVDNITARYRRKGQGPASVNTFRATAITNCDVCSGSTASGSNLRIEPSIVTLVEGGDADEFLDNCETGRVDLVVKNIGVGSLTNVRILRVAASNAAVRIGSMPQAVSSSLGQCLNAPATLRVAAAGLAPREALTLRIEVTSDELAAQGITRSVDVTFANSEQDFVYRTTKTYSFESGDEGWQRVSGTFNRDTTGGGANLTGTYMASSSLVDGACDNIRSPEVKLTPASTLTVYNQFTTEPWINGWFDRANVGIYDLTTGTRALVIPSSGRAYLATGANGVCVTAGQQGWAAAGPGWLPSNWTAGDLKSAANANRKVQLDVGYGTEPIAAGTGFWFDEVTLTEYWEQVNDGQSSCPAP